MNKKKSAWVFFCNINEVIAFLLIRVWCVREIIRLSSVLCTIMPSFVLRGTLRDDESPCPKVNLKSNFHLSHALKTLYCEMLTYEPFPNNAKLISKKKKRKGYVQGLPVPSQCAGVRGSWGDWGNTVGQKKYLVSHQLCKFSHLKRWERPLIFIIGTLQLWQTKWENKFQKITL